MFSTNLGRSIAGPMIAELKRRQLHTLGPQVMVKPPMDQLLNSICPQWSTRLFPLIFSGLLSEQQSYRGLFSDQDAVREPWMLTSCSYHHLRSQLFPPTRQVLNITCIACQSVEFGPSPMTSSANLIRIFSYVDRADVWATVGLTSKQSAFRPFAVKWKALNVAQARCSRLHCRRRLLTACCMFEEQSGKLSES